jgi:hypothetical protein
MKVDLTTHLREMRRKHAAYIWRSRLSLFWMLTVGRIGRLTRRKCGSCFRYQERWDGVVLCCNAGPCDPYANTKAVTPESPCGKWWYPRWLYRIEQSRKIKRDNKARHESEDL